ncbi:MAG TPA: 3-hydroxyacyl-CoA dehydrogenase NAD-binding domain-containing protein [Tepidisphaeraceae bacterium]|jgi:3-hydroxyacyl-CoA dehydrogenase/enoyl-CoA hydratase/3-hydroxybutyryl-CoA epimerase|nr:3-hydroxyacyl-CoA dehydrogenase NAD-binding domain-containing protein [Tepidisphaeraceae bacterium]
MANTIETTNVKPANADVVLQTLRTTKDGDGIVTIVLDAPGKSVNTLSQLMLAELGDALSRVEADPPKGVIFASAKKRSFIAGADLFEIKKMSPEQATKYLADGQTLFTRIEKLPCPTVAAISGDCLGGGFELALACRARVAADDSSINIGLPEVKLGILPGWGGTGRLPRLIGLAEALPLLLAGKTLPPAKAKRARMIDDVVRPEALPAAARRLVKKPPEHRPAPLLHRAATAMRFTRDKIFQAGRDKTLEQTHGNYPAPMRLIEVAKAGWENGPQAGFDAERKALVELIDTDVSRNLIRLFFLKQGAKKAIAEQVHAKPADVKYAAVVGGGTMGAGIVYSLARAGIEVRLIEVDPKAVSAGLVRVRKSFDDDVKSGRLSALDAKHAMNRVVPTTQWTGLHLADIVIEAVVEKMPLKREVFAKLDRLVRPDCVLATNTSSLSVSEMAEATEHPHRVVGLHFFNPVPKMPLVEVVRTASSDEQSLATAAGLAAKIGKTAVMVKDSPGFLVNRILIPYLAEAVAMAGEGISIVDTDTAMKKWGMPMGPFELLDEIGLDVSAHVLKSLGSQIGSDRIPTSPIVDKALERGWLGKKSGTGFYIYANDKAKKKQPPTLNMEMASFCNTNSSATGVPLDANTIAWRLVLPMVNEAARLLAEGVVESTDAVDLAMVLGTGFAPFRGGLVQFVDAVGVEKIVGEMQALADKQGPRFVPAPLLRDLVAQHLSMRDFAKMEHHDAHATV